MLSPTDRMLLGEALRPPEGYQFDRAIGTTFTLDLLTLLTMPVAFTLFKWSGGDGQPKADPTALLEAVRRHARHMHVFCQAGRISVPRSRQLLYGFLENTVIEVTAPKGGVFHPKLTVLRFVSDAGNESDQQVVYRLLNASRNLTFDRSWDTLLVLEGELARNRKRAIRTNKPLSDFVSALPGMAVGTAGSSVTNAVNQIADELLRVNFEAPEGFRDLAFWPIGHRADEEPWPFDCRTDHVLAVAPFVDNTFMEKMGAQCESLQLVSRTHDIDRLTPDTLADCDQCFVLNDAADVVEDDLTEEADTGGSDDAAETEKVDDAIPIIASEKTLRGLHAKLFVADAGHSATLWTGSANATRAAFEYNVEFLVQMSGTRKRCGVKALMGKTGDPDQGEDGTLSFGDMLVPYEPDPTQAPPADSLDKEFDQLIDQARKALIQAQLHIDITPGSETTRNCFTLAVTSRSAAGWFQPSGTHTVIRPIGLRPDAAIPLTPGKGERAAFSDLSFEAITSFMAFEVTATVGRETCKSAFVMNLPMHGAPENRDQHLLIALLSNRQRLLRYLFMLLTDTEVDPQAFLGGDHEHHDQHGAKPVADWTGLPLLEPMLKTLAQQPQRLDRIASLINDLRSTAQGRELVPDAFMAVWEPIWAARGEVSNGDA